MSTQVSTDRRASVVGVGAITAQGGTAHDLWDGVVSGKVAITTVRHLPMDGYRTSIAGEVQVDAEPGVDVGYPAGRRDRALDFALVAADEAVRDSGLRPGQIPSDRWGVVVGSCNGGLLSAEQWYLERAGTDGADPRLLLFVSPQAIAEAVAGAHGIRGPVLSVNTACAAGANAIGYAAEIIRYGLADAVLTGGTDALSDVLVAGFNSLESLSPDPAAPYSHDRTGLSLGEGSGMCVLVREDLARDLGLTVYADIGGLGLSADGYHPTAPRPDGVGAARAIRAALAGAGVPSCDIAYVNSHGTGTAKNDPAETNAMKVGLGDDAHSAAVSSTKSMIGHLLGAAGAVEAIVTVKALEHRTAPPTANFTGPSPDCDLDYVPNSARPLAMDAALSNNFAFGGANASLVLTRGRPDTRPAPTAERVLVTGLGVLTPQADTAESLWAAFTSSASAPDGGARAGAEERPDVRTVGPIGDAFLAPRVRRRMDRLGVLSVEAAHRALTAAGLDPREGGGERIGNVLGTGVGPMEAMEAFSRPLFTEGPRAANPAVFPNTVYNAAAGHVAMNLGVHGPTTTVTTGHAAGAAALVYARDLVARGQADAMVALAADSPTPTVVEGYRSLGVVGPRGFSLSEAGLAVVLQRRPAGESGERALGEFLGYGIASDGRGVGRWAPDGDAMERAIRQALDMADLTPEQIVAVWSSQSGYRPWDAAERSALGRVFDGTGAAVLSPLLALGQPVGAGAHVAVALSVTGWGHGRWVGPALVTSTSLGGTCIALVLAPDGPRP